MRHGPSGNLDDQRAVDVSSIPSFAKSRERLSLGVPRVGNPVGPQVDSRGCALGTCSSDPALTIRRPMRVQLDEPVNELVEVLLAPRASDMPGTNRCWPAAPRTEPQTTPILCLRSCMAAPSCEDFREPVVHDTAELHVARHALVRRPRVGVCERHRLAALRAEHVGIVARNQRESTKEEADGARCSPTTTFLRPERS